MNLELNGKLVLITGSTAGIGYGIAKRFFDQGARVVVNGRDATATREAAERIRTEVKEPAVAGGETIPVAGDVSNKESADALIAAVRALGELDVLVANVGIFKVQPFAEIPDEEWERFFQVNVMGTVRVARAFLPRMLERDAKGRVIFISSEVAFAPMSEMIHYSMTKAAQVSIARGLAELCAGTTVTVNSVLPGPTWTEGVAVYIDGMAAQKGITRDECIKDYFKTVNRTSIIQRFIRVEEIADTVVYVASARAAATNGHALRVEGGCLHHV